MESPPILLITGVDCRPGKEKAFNEWYDSSFPPAMIEVPGITRIDRYERLEEDDNIPRFLSIVQFENMEAVDNMVNIEMVASLGKRYIEEGSKFGIRFYWAARYRSIYSTKK